MSRFKHLVQPETARQTELAGTQPPSEVSVDDIPQGVKALEASLNEERMAQAVEMFEKLDKNKDGKITVPEVPAKQFENKAWVQANINVDELKKAIAHVVFSAATEDSRPVLTGVKCDISGDTFTMAAADGFRLAVYTGKLSSAVEEDLQFVIPAKALSEISRLAGAQNEDVIFTVTPSKSQALIKLENIELVSQLIQGSFPDYNQLLPDNYDNKVIVTQDQFLAATKTAAIFARDGSGIIRLQSTGSGDGARLMISSRAEEIGESEGEVDATIESGSNDMKIAFNARYLSDVLDVIGQGNVVLETTSPSSPGVLKAEGNDQYIHVVMPMFVQW